MYNEEEMVRRIEELEEIVSILGDSVVTNQKEIKNLQDAVDYCRGSVDFVRTRLSDFIRCVSNS